MVQILTPWGDPWGDRGGAFCQITLTSCSRNDIYCPRLVVILYYAELIVICHCVTSLLLVKNLPGQLFTTVYSA